MEKIEKVLLDGMVSKEIEELENEIRKMEWDLRWLEQNGDAGCRNDQLTIDFLMEDINEAKDILNSLKLK